MPAAYEKIKSSLLSRGYSEKESKKIAAATYIKARGKPGSKERSQAAKSLHKD